MRTSDLRTNRLYGIWSRVLKCRAFSTWNARRISTPKLLGCMGYGLQCIANRSLLSPSSRLEIRSPIFILIAVYSIWLVPRPHKHKTSNWLKQKPSERTSHPQKHISKNKTSRQPKSTFQSQTKISHASNKYHTSANHTMFQSDQSVKEAAAAPVL